MAEAETSDICYQSSYSWKKFSLNKKKWKERKKDVKIFYQLNISKWAACFSPLQFHTPILRFGILLNLLLVLTHDLVDNTIQNILSSDWTWLCTINVISFASLKTCVEGSRRSTNLRGNYVSKTNDETVALIIFVPPKNRCIYFKYIDAAKQFYLRWVWWKPLLSITNTKFILISSKNHVSNWYIDEPLHLFSDAEKIPH